MKRFRAISWYFKKYWWKYILVILLSIAIIYCDILKPEIIGQAVDVIGLGQITEESLMMLLITLIGVVLIKFVITIFKQITLGNLFHKLYYQIKIRFMKNILLQDADYFTEYHPGDLMTRATADTFSMSNVSTHLIFGLITVILTLVMTAIKMFTMHPLLALYSILPLPFIFIVVVILRPKISQNWRLVRKKNSDMSNLTMESVQHVKLIRAFVNENDDYKKLDNSAEDCYNTERKNVLLQSTFGPTFRFFTNISQLVAYGYGAYLIINQEFTVGELITFSLLLAQFSMPMMQLGNQVAMFTQSGVSFERVTEVLLATPDIIDRENAIEIDDFNNIKFNNFKFKYPNSEIDILKGIDLEINKGKSLGIVGKTGCGKSTLVKQLLRRYPVSSDDILEIDDISINDYKKNDVRRIVSYVPQEHVLFARSVKENILIGANASHTIDLDYAIKMADFEKDLAFLEDGLETIVGEYGVTLSGGQKQRLSIARALMKDAPILILDDSLSAVDGTTEANIIKNLKEIRNNKTNIIIAHRLTAVEACDEIIVMDSGKIVERGTHEELMNLKEWYYEQYIIQEMGGDDHDA